MAGVDWSRSTAADYDLTVTILGLAAECDRVAYAYIDMVPDTVGPILVKRVPLAGVDQVRLIRASARAPATWRAWQMSSTTSRKSAPTWGTTSTIPTTAGVVRCHVAPRHRVVLEMVSGVAYRRAGGTWASIPATLLEGRA